MTTAFNEGQSFFCRHCQSPSVIKIKREYRDFTLVREIPLCAFCQAELAVEQISPAATTTPPPAVSPRPRHALAELLGEDDDAPAPPDAATLLQGHQERRFCKNCDYNFLTPFKCQCTLHRQEVEPLHDCPDFRPKNAPSGL